MMKLKGIRYKYVAIMNTNFSILHLYFIHRGGCGIRLASVGGLREFGVLLPYWNSNWNCYGMGLQLWCRGMLLFPNIFYIN